MERSPAETVTRLMLAFVPAASVLMVTPSLGTALVLRASTVEGLRRAGFAAVGIGIGCLAWGAAVSVGFGALLAASEVDHAALKWIGAAYLVWIGVGLVRRPHATLASDGATARAPSRGGASSGWLAKGMLTNVLSPKIGVFYVTFLP